MSGSIATKGFPLAEYCYNRGVLLLLHPESYAGDRQHGRAPEDAGADVRGLVGHASSFSDWLSDPGCERRGMWGYVACRDSPANAP
jgi:hypothetical protein